MKFLDNLFDSSRIYSYTRFLITYRYFVLILAIMISAGALWMVRAISVDSSIMALLPKTTPSVQRVNEMEKKTGGFGDLIVMLESPDKTTAIAFAEKILPEIRRLPWVDRASFRMNDSVFQSNRLLYMEVYDLEEIRDRIQSKIAKKQSKYNPFLVDLTETEDKGLDFSDIEKKYAGKGGIRKTNLSDDGKILLIVINPRGITSNIAFAKKIYADIQNIVARFEPVAEHDGIKVSIGGTYRNRLDEYSSILFNVKSSAAAAALVILLMLFFYFRRPSYVISLLIPLFMSLFWTFAITSVTIKTLNLITVFLIVVLFGLGIDFGIHLLCRYRGLRKSGLDHEQSLIGAVRNGGRASLSAALTSVAAFYMLMFSDFLGFRHFGFIAGTGVLLAYLSYMTVFPVLLTILDDLWGKSKKTVTAKVAIPKESSSTEMQPLKSHGITVAIIGTCIVLTIIAAWYGRKISFENDFRNLRARVPATREFNAKVKQVFKTARDPAAILVENENDARSIISALTVKHLFDSTSPVEEVKSLLDIIPDNQSQKLRIIGEIKEMLHKFQPYIHGEQKIKMENMSKWLVDVPITIEDIPREISRYFMGVDGTRGQLMYLYQRKSLMDMNAADEFAQAVGEIKADGKLFHAVSEPLVYVDLLHLVERDAVIAIVGAFFLIFLIVLLDFGKMRSTLLIISTLAIGIIWMLGGMVLLNVKLNLFNLVIFPSILGLAVDSAIHIYHRFEEQGGLSDNSALLETGGATIMSMLTTLVGFGSFFFGSDPHPGLQSLGITAIIGMSACLVASLTFLPAVSILMRNKKTHGLAKK